MKANEICTARPSSWNRSEQLLRSKSEIKQLIPAGDFRRGCELVSDLAIVAETTRLEGGPRKSCLL